MHANSSAQISVNVQDAVDIIKQQLNVTKKIRHGVNILKGVSYRKFLELNTNYAAQIMMMDLFIWIDDYENLQQDKIRIAACQPNLGYDRLCVRLPKCTTDSSEFTFYIKFYVEIHRNNEWNDKFYHHYLDQDDDEYNHIEYNESLQRDKESYTEAAKQLQRLVDTVNQKYNSNYNVDEVRKLFTGNPYNNNGMQILVPIKYYGTYDGTVAKFLENYCSYKQNKDKFIVQEQKFYQLKRDYNHFTTDMNVATELIDMRYINVYQFIVDCYKKFQTITQESRNYSSSFRLSEYLD